MFVLLSEQCSFISYVGPTCFYTFINTILVGFWIFVFSLFCKIYFEKLTSYYDFFSNNVFFCIYVLLCYMQARPSPTPRKKEIRYITTTSDGTDAVCHIGHFIHNWSYFSMWDQHLTQHLTQTWNCITQKIWNLCLFHSLKINFKFVHDSMKLYIVLIITDLYTYHSFFRQRKAVYIKLSVTK